MQSVALRALLLALAILAASCGGGGSASGPSAGPSADDNYVNWNGNVNEYLILDRTSEQFAVRRSDRQVVRLSDGAVLNGLSVDATAALVASGTRIGVVSLMSTPARAVFLCLDGSLLDIESIGAAWNWNCQPTNPGGGGGSGGGGGGGGSSNLGEGANQCVSVRRVAGKNFAEMNNVCSYTIEVTWCYENLDCANGTWGMTSQTTLQPGQTKDAATFGNNAAQYILRFAACRGANVFYRELSPGSGECRP